MAKPRRRHIHHRIDATELPVTHETLHQGSPHKLTLTKTDQLFENEARERQVARRRLAAARRFMVAG